MAVISVLADGDAIGASTLVVLGAFEALIDALGSYHGRHPSNAVATVQLRMVAVIDRQKRWRETDADLQALCPLTRPKRSGR